MFGGVPGEVFDMQNPNLRSKMMEYSPPEVKKDENRDLNSLYDFVLKPPDAYFKGVL